MGKGGGWRRCRRLKGMGRSDARLLQLVNGDDAVLIRVEEAQRFIERSLAERRVQRAQQARVPAATARLNGVAREEGAVAHGAIGLESD